jgi:ribonuclease HI
MNNATEQTDLSTTTSLSADDRFIVVYCDGAGARPNGKGSGFSWIQPETGQKHVEKIDGLTNNQAEYRALLSALSSIPNGSKVRVFTDSQLMTWQVRGFYRVHSPELVELLSQVRLLIKERDLILDLRWISRNKNLAGKLL